MRCWGCTTKRVRDTHEHNERGDHVRAGTALHLLILPMAGVNHGSSRLRAYNYAPYLRSAGHRVGVVDRTAVRNPVGYVFAITTAIASADTVLLQKRLLPGWYIRFWRSRGKRFVYDFDDAIHLEASGNPSRLADRMAACIRSVDCVIAGNEYLADHARTLNARVAVIPTPVEHCRDTIPAKTVGEQFRVAWIGSRSSLPDLAAIGPSLAQATRALPTLTLVVIGPERLSIQGVSVENLAWDISTADDHLAGCHAGIMPIPDNAYGRGKCSYKALQCMAASLPVVASDVGMNRELIQDGVNGLLASSPDHWARHLGALASSADLRHGLARNSVETARRFLRSVWAPRLADCLTGVDSPP